MSNPPKPIELRRKLGNPGKQALPKQNDVILMPAISEIPEPSRQLFDAGLVLWNRIWAMGQLWISPNTDVELLLMTCEMLDERVRLRSFVWNNPEAWRERKALRELEKNITNSLSLLGFTPTDRSRLGIAEVKAKSKLEELRARRDDRN